MEKDQRDVPTWRPARGAVLLLAVPMLAIVLSTTSAVLQVADPVDRTIGDVVFALSTLIMLVVGLGLTAVLAARTRTRLLPTGVEVRQFRRRIYRYDDIADVRIDRATNDRTIKMTLRNAGPVTLPAPTRGLRKLSDPTLDKAVLAIRDRANLGPAPRRLP